MATGSPNAWPHDLRVLRFRVAREVGNIERERRPVADHRGERRKEDGEKLARGVELAGRREHGAEAARLDAHPDQQRRGHDKHERRAEGLQVADGFDAAPDHDHIQQPEAEKAGPQHAVAARPTQAR